MKVQVEIAEAEENGERDCEQGDGKQHFEQRESLLVGRTVVGDLPHVHR
jgi:hypothetical protein